MLATVSIQPLRAGAADVSDGMGHSGRNEDFLARFGSETPAPELQFQPALDRHHQFVGRVAVILPHLTGRINPKITTEAPRLPLLGDCLLIDRGPIPFLRQRVEAVTQELSSLFAVRRMIKQILWRGESAARQDPNRSAIVRFVLLTADRFHRSTH